MKEGKKAGRKHKNDQIIFLIQTIHKNLKREKWQREILFYRWYVWFYRVC
jgi:hypothetical protein